jgi:hypothetical protein
MNLRNFAFLSVLAVSLIIASCSQKPEGMTEGELLALKIKTEADSIAFLAEALIYVVKDSSIMEELEFELATWKSQIIDVADHNTTACGHDHGHHYPDQYTLNLTDEQLIEHQKNMLESIKMLFDKVYQATVSKMHIEPENPEI